MLGKFGILAVILILVFLFFIVISFGAGFFSKGEKSPEIKKSSMHRVEVIKELYT